MDTEKLLDTTSEEINEIIANTQRHYLRFTIKKHSGGNRIIEAPSPILKRIQRNILDTILYKARAHPIAHGFAPFKSPKTNAEVHKDAKILLTVDIKNFFPSINRNQVRNMFSFLNEKKKFVNLDLTSKDFDLLTELVTFADELPQGAPTSPMLANLICLGMDKELKQLAMLGSLRVSRYCDDITFSTTDKDYDIGRLLKPVSAILHRHYFNLNKEKTRILRTHRQQKITGVVINKELSAPKRYRKLVRAQVHRWANKPHEERTIEEYQKIRGRIAWIAFLNPKHGSQLLKKLGSKKP